MMSSDLRMIVIKPESPLDEKRQPQTFTEFTLYFTHLEKNLRPAIGHKTHKKYAVFAK